MLQKYKILQVTTIHVINKIPYGANNEFGNYVQANDASIYRTLLREIEADNFQVLHQRIALTPLRKLWLAWKVQALGRF